MNTTRKTTSSKISKKVHDAVWDTYMGDFTKGLCMCCSREKISVFNWDCGHIISRKNNGSEKNILKRKWNFLFYDIFYGRPKICKMLKKLCVFIHFHIFFRAVLVLLII